MTSPTPSLRDLFDAALALGSAGRAALFDEHRLSVAERDHLDRLLAADADAGEPVSAGAIVELGRVLGEDDPVSVRPAGERVGPYVLGPVIGEGGSATVFHATRALEGDVQHVALKLMRQSLHSPEALRRFRREQRALLSLRHPNIARLIDGGVTDAATPYIALELVDGTPITTHAHDHALDLRARLALFEVVCAAVDAAHRALIVHRDLKPSNVLVTHDGEVKLLDFGVAKLLADEDDGEYTMIPAFTPAYAAPEQRANGAITTATDVYALGVLLGELLTGERISAEDSRTPSERIGDTTQRGALPALMPVTRRQVRGDLDAIVMKAVEPDPARRYASAGALADDIRRQLEGRPVQARRASRWYRARKFVGRHRGGVVSTAAFLVAILAALGFAVWQARVAQVQTGIVRAQAERAEAVRQFLVGVFGHASPDENGGKPFSANELLAKGERQVDASLHDQPALQADVLTLLGQLRMEIGDFAAAAALMERANKASEVQGLPDDVRVRVLLGLASVEMETDAADPAIGHASEALEIAARDPANNAAARANAHRLITQALIVKGDYNGLEALLHANLQQDQAALGRDNEYVADQWLQLGQRLGDLGRYDESEAAFKQGIEGYRSVFGESSTRVAHALNELSNMLDDKGDLAGSEAALRRALKIRIDTVGADHHDTLVVRSNLLAVMEFEGRYSEALVERLEIVDHAARTGSLHGRDLVANYNGIGKDLRELGRLPESEPPLRKALEITDQSQGPRSPWQSVTLAHLSRTQLLEGRYAAAEATLREALSIVAASDPTNVLQTGFLRAELANLLRLQHRNADALAEAKAAGLLFTPSIGASNRLRPGMLAMVAEVELDGGDAAQAKSTAQQALAYARMAFPEHHSSLAIPLFSLARAELALGHAELAESLVREALAVRAGQLPPQDPRILELQVALVASTVVSQPQAAHALRERIEPALLASRSPYARDLLARLGTSAR